MAEAFVFYSVSILMFTAAISVVCARHPLYSVLSLLIVMGSLAVFFIMLGAFFIATIQILLYAGAVLVLFLFVIMLLNLSPEAFIRLRPKARVTLGLVGSACLFMLLVSLLLRSFVNEPPLADLPAPQSRVESIGQLLFTQYLIPFELTSFLILAALVGAVSLAKQHSGNDK